MKICNKCNIEKEISEFSFRKDTQKHRSECIQCRSIKHKEWRNNNPNKVKQNKKKYNEQNKEKRNIYLKSKRETDVNFRLISNTRSRIHHALNGKSKSSPTKDVLGIDIDLYRKWIE